MRKRITQESIGSNLAITNKTEESQMENLLKFYAKTFKRMSYTKDVDTQKERLDYMECLQEVIANYLENKTEVINLKYYILRAAKNEMKDRYKKESRMDITDQNFEAEIYCFNLGEVIAAKEAIQKLLTVSEYEVITSYGQGFTLEEIAVKIGVAEAKQVQRILFKARKKIDTLKMEVMYDSKVAQYQGKQGKADIKYQDTIYDEKLDTYKEVKHIPSEVINRKFICLDQSKVKKQLLPADYSGIMTVNRKEVITEIASATDKNKYEVKILNGQYMESNLGNFENNKEVIQLYKNRSEYNKMIRSNCTVVKENRYNIEFAEGRYISTDHKFKNLPA
jgi:DNA-directed RNA polymerase specialized sigma24 family protein